ncbi:MAG TPA: hypothetical protein PK453_04960 [Leptospiraceae bacterium]|nr:hypothetical protein [Leptospiraceae bacterium]HMY68187.1 hypothetical protein [Leptospiraceae bacterium]HNF12998.1 hypothetical protein [Leptospiraceae bacterium]HNF22987.1 hypothetical protein [Leptospiraceae bacterium]HNI98942.1 hypothetical protein [Leptospiraceae bacterium]
MEFLHNILHIRKSVYAGNEYDIELHSLNDLKTYSSAEAHITLYPYSRKIHSDHIGFFPFEDYVRDIQSNYHSAYSRSERGFHRIFGFLLGFIIVMFFYIFKPSELYSLEGVVSVFAAYAIGKEIWGDIEKFLQRTTRESRIRFQEDYYNYDQEKLTTLTHYTAFAKKKRYGKSAVMPSRLHFLQMSNSQTLRMLFLQEDLCRIPDSSAHIFSVITDPDRLDELEDKGFLFGFKLSLNRKFLFFSFTRDYYQSSDDGKIGCLDREQNWVSDGALCRTVFSVGRVRFILKIAVEENLRLLDFMNFRSVKSKKLNTGKNRGNTK